jgi:ligand-binding SRPBCC domain-containing protein
MIRFRLHRTIRVPSPLSEVFPFFADPMNLDSLTPPWLRFRILTPAPITMAVGSLIDYRLRLRGIPIRWRTEITDFEPPHRFVDRQVRGPYREWVHEHVFEELDGHTIIIDNVTYAVLGGPVVQQLFVKRDLDRIFDYRHARIATRFPAPIPAPGNRGV